MRFINENYDSYFKNLDGLKWLPWIGEEFDNKKIVLLGESQYEDGHDWQEGNEIATRILIDKCINGNKGKLHRNVEKVILSQGNPDLEEGNLIWKSVAYWNLVQRLMTSIDQRPSETDFDFGWKIFFDLFEIIKPEIVIVLGKSSSGRLGYFLNNNKTDWIRNVDDFYNKEKTVINLTKQNHKLKLIFINHPSGSFGFNYLRWAKLVKSEAPNLKKTIIT